MKGCVQACPLVPSPTLARLPSGPRKHSRASCLPFGLLIHPWLESWHVPEEEEMERLEAGMPPGQGGRAGDQPLPPLPPKHCWQMLKGNGGCSVIRAMEQLCAMLQVRAIRAGHLLHLPALVECWRGGRLLSSLQPAGHPNLPPGATALHTLSKGESAHSVKTSKLRNLCQLQPQRPPYRGLCIQNYIAARKNYANMTQFVFNHNPSFHPSISV